MIQANSEERMRVPLVLYPVLAPRVSFLEVIRALGKSRDQLARQRKLFVAISRGQFMDHFDAFATGFGCVGLNFYCRRGGRAHLAGRSV